MQKKILLTLSLVACFTGMMSLAMAKDPDPAQVPYKQYEHENHRGIWDNNFTQGRSGLGDHLPDPGATDDKTGVKPAPQSFPIPPPRQADDVDPEDLERMIGKDYSPYALLQMPHRIIYQGHNLNKGYYHVMLGNAHAGSRNNSLKAYRLAQKKKQHKQVTSPAKQTPTQAAPAKSEDPDAFRTIVLKQLGNVILVLPVEERERYNRPKNGRKYDRPGAFLVHEEGEVPVLKVVYKDWVYSCVLQ